MKSMYKKCYGDENPFETKFCLSNEGKRGRGKSRNEWKC